MHLPVVCFSSVSAPGLEIGHQSVVISVFQWFFSVQPGSDWECWEGRAEGRKEGGRWLQTPAANCNANYEEFLEAEPMWLVLPGTGDTHRVTPDVSSPVLRHRTHTVTPQPCPCCVSFPCFPHTASPPLQSVSSRASPPLQCFQTLFYTKL